MAKLITIYWRDIPAQIIGQEGRRRHKQELSKRFAVAIDRAAMRAGRGSSTAYLEDWRRERSSCRERCKRLSAQRQVDWRHCSRTMSWSVLSRRAVTIRPKLMIQKKVLSRT